MCTQATSITPARTPTAAAADRPADRPLPQKTTFGEVTSLPKVKKEIECKRLEAVALAHHITSQSTSHHITSRITLHHITSPHHIATTHHITSHQPSHHLHITSHHPSHHLHITSHIKSGIQKEVLKQKRIVSRKQ